MIVGPQGKLLEVVDSAISVPGGSDDGLGVETMIVGDLVSGCLGSSDGAGKHVVHVEEDSIGSERRDRHRCCFRALHIAGPEARACLRVLLLLLLLRPSEIFPFSCGRPRKALNGVLSRRSLGVAVIHSAKRVGSGSFSSNAARC